LKMRRGGGEKAILCCKGEIFRLWRQAEAGKGSGLELCTRGTAGILPILGVFLKKRPRAGLRTGRFGGGAASSGPGPCRKKGNEGKGLEGIPGPANGSLKGQRLTNKKEGKKEMLIARGRGAGSGPRKKVRASPCQSPGRNTKGAVRKQREKPSPRTME